MSKCDEQIVVMKENGDYVFNRLVLRFSRRSISAAVLASSPSPLPLDIAELIAEFGLAPCARRFIGQKGWSSSVGAVYGAKRTRSGRRRHPGITINLEEKNISEPDALALAAVVACDVSRVLSVDLGSNQLGDRGTAAISRALACNNRSEILDLQSNDVGAEGLAAVASLLATNRRLSVLHLGLNPRVGDDGVAAMAAAVKSNRTLTGFLGLNTVGCTERGAAALAEALKANGSLRAVGLDDNEVGDNGVVALADMLRENDSLEFLGLNNVGMTDIGVAALAEALKVNRTLKRLNVRSNRDLTEEMLEMFNDDDILCEVTGDINPHPEGSNQSGGGNIISVGSNIGVMFSTD